MTDFLNKKMFGNLTFCSALSVMLVEVSKQAIPTNPRLLLIISAICISLSKFMIEEQITKESIATFVLNTISILIGASGMYELGVKQLLSIILKT